MNDNIIKYLTRENIKYEKIISLAGDASERKYFLIEQNQNLNVLMLDNDQNNLKKYIDLTLCLKNYVTVPNIISEHIDSGILIIENFKKKKFSEILTQSNSLELYKIAVDALIFIHKVKPEIQLLSYSKDLFFYESDLFFDWFLNESNEVRRKLKSEFNNHFKDYLDKVFLLPSVFVHRDYHIDNLFYLENREHHLRCGWIDFQDAVDGPCVYDLVSLTQDARIDVDKKTEDIIIQYYLREFPEIDKEDFLFSYSVIAIQRHLKVLGIFSRLATRDKKKVYLKYIPRVLRMLEINLKRIGFDPLLKILQKSLDL